MLRCSLVAAAGSLSGALTPSPPRPAPETSLQRLATLPDRFALVKSRFRGSACRFLSAPVRRGSVSYRLTDPLSTSVSALVAWLRLWSVKVPVAWSGSGLPRFRGPGNLALVRPAGPSPFRPELGEIITLASSCQIRLSALRFPSVCRLRLPPVSAHLSLRINGAHALVHNLAVKVHVISDPAMISLPALRVKSTRRPVAGYCYRWSVGRKSPVEPSRAPLRAPRLGSHRPPHDTRAEVTTASPHGQIAPAVQN